MMTPGKIYFGKPDLDDAEISDLDWFELTDDAGKVARLKPEDGRFEFPNEVYAVALEPFGDFERGEVVTVDDVSSEGNFVSVQGVGYRRVESVVVLDRTNLFPGVAVMDGSTGCWREVVAVDECMWIAIEPRGIQRAPTEFRFAVADGEVMIKPLVKCVSAEGEPGLTVGKRYYLKKVGRDGIWTVMSDDGEEREYSQDRFIWG